MNAVLILIAVLLLMIILLQIGKVMEHIGGLRDQEKVEQESNDRIAALLALSGFGVLIFSIVSIFPYMGRFLPEASSVQGVAIDGLTRQTFYITGIVYIITQVLLFGFVWKYRYKKERKAYFFPDDNKLEFAWTIIPAIVLTFLVVRGLFLWYDVLVKDPGDNVVVIEAVGQQFQWNIRYAGEDGEFGPRSIKLVDPTNELGIDWRDAVSHDDIFKPMDIVIPVDRNVKINIGSLDVLHNFYLPHFRMKMDAVPGIPTSFWFTPTKTTAEMKITQGEDFEYELACAELCGSAHYNMRKKVIVVTGEEYEAWMAEQTPYYEQVVLPSLPTGENK